MCVKITLPKLREELINCWSYFEKIVDTKDFVISLCMDELRKHEDTYYLNQQHHQDNIQRLMEELAKNLQEIHKENNDAVS